MERKEEKRSGDRVVIVRTREKVPRDFHIRKEDAEKHGYTRGCGGCSSWFRGLARQPRSEACRNRFKDLVRDDARMKNQQQRKRDFEEKGIERKRENG